MAKKLQYTKETAKISPITDMIINDYYTWTLHVDSNRSSES